MRPGSLNSALVSRTRLFRWKSALCDLCVFQCLLNLKFLWAHNKAVCSSCYNCYAEKICRKNPIGPCSLYSLRLGAKELFTVINISNTICIADCGLIVRRLNCPGFLPQSKFKQFLYVSPVIDCNSQGIFLSYLKNRLIYLCKSDDSRI